MAEDNLSKALYVYAHFRSRPGDVLDANYFLGIGRLRSWLTGDLQDGIDQARQHGYVEKTVGGWRLTPAGFQQIENVAAQ